MPLLCPKPCGSYLRPPQARFTGSFQAVYPRLYSLATVPHDITKDCSPRGEEVQGLESEVARLIVDTLNLEQVEAEDIDPDAPLFNEGLGLDSIDALELALALSQRYGFQVAADDADNDQIFASLRSLCRHVEVARTK